jgi:hypothetical protein
MNTPGLFIIGAVVMIIVASAIAVLIYGAILDGRDIREEELSEANRPPGP